MALAAAILAAHLAIILFNLFGLIAVPLGAVWRWQFVRVRWWRLLHLVALAAVAAQAVLGRACFLTIWQAALTGATGRPTPLSWAGSTG
jgi:Zn-dependent protease